MSESEISLEQMAEDWLDPDYQYEGSQQEYLEWSADYETGYDTGPVEDFERSPVDLNVPWREHPEARVGTEVLEPYYKTEDTWWEKVIDAVDDFAPVITKIFSPRPTASSQFPVIQPTTGQQQPETTDSTLPVLGAVSQRPETSAGPVFFGSTATGGPNYMLYAAIGLAAYYLLR